MLIGFESGGPIRAVILREKMLSLIAELTSEEGGGSTWEATFQFELSSNGAVLSDVDLGEHPMVRYKCPSQVPYLPKKARP
jgi:hypothetical protein